MGGEGRHQNYTPNSKQKQIPKPEKNNERIELKESQYTILVRCFEIIPKSSSQPCHGMLQ